MTRRTVEARERPDQRSVLEVEGVLKVLASAPTNAVLDAACGTGRYFAHLLERTDLLVGFDLAPAMLRQARSRFPRVPLVRADLMGGLPFGAACFSCVLCAQTLNHCPDLDPPFLEFMRVLRPGGVLVFSVTYEMRDALAVLLPGEADIFRRERDDYFSALSCAGFEEAALHDIRVSDTVAYAIFEAKKPAARKDRMGARTAAPAEARGVAADPSNGYESVAAEFLAGRGRAPSTAVGVREVRDWARALGPGASVLDLGCGSGLPITRALIGEGLKVHGIDAAPSLVEAFWRNCPGIPVACEAVQDSSFFGRTFDGVVAWGLIFLLLPEDQRRLIPKVAGALVPGGRFLFTAGAAPLLWHDAMTGVESRSLGAAEYGRLLFEAGLSVAREYEDGGRNHYFDAVKR